MECEIPFTENEGYVVDLSVNNNFLVVHTAKNMIKLFDITKSVANQLGISRKFTDTNGKSLGEIIHSSVNKTGTLVLLINKEKKCYIYDTTIDMIYFVNQFALKALWDKIDERFFALQTRNDKFEPEIQTYFYSTESGSKKLDTYPNELNE